MKNLSMKNLSIFFSYSFPLILFLSLNIFKHSFTSFSLILYSSFIPILWMILGALYSDKISKKINLIIFLLYSLFLYSHTRAIEPILSKDTLFIITMLFFSWSALSSILLAINRKLTTYFTLLSMAIVSFISVILLVIYKTTGSISKDSIYALLQSNTDESFSFMIEYVFTIKSFLLLMLLISILIIIVSFRSKLIKNIDVKLKLMLILFFCTITLNTYSDSSFSGLKQIINHYNSYQQELLLLKERVLKAQERKRKIYALKEEELNKRKGLLIPSDKVNLKSDSGQLHVLVIGESLAKFNLSSYGYLNQTTPWLTSSKDKIQFSNVYSNHTHTMPTLSKSLTSSNQYNGKNYYTSPSVISELNLAGYKTAWISNQVRTGAWDNLVSIIAEESDYVKFTNSNIGKTTQTDYLDGVLYDELKGYLLTIDKKQNNFIVLHMMGSHGGYCARTKGEVINLKKRPKQFYNNKDNLCYDKSVFYTDLQLKKIHDLLRQEKTFSSMIFMPDHADDVINRLGHNSGKFTEYMSEIPMFIWTGKNISRKTVTNLKLNKDKVFTNDLLFDTVLGIAGVNSSSIESRYDLSSSNYVDLKEKGTTLHGKIKIKDFPTNVSKNNVLTNPHFMAHIVNSIGSLIDAYNQKFQRIEFDVFYDEKSDLILMGHGKGAPTGGTLKEFLVFENNKFSKLWIDFKNINQNNIKKIKNRLDKLDIEFNLRSRSMIESGMRSSEFSILSKKWYTSYYLPTGNLLKVIKENNEKKAREYTLELVKQLKHQKVGSISFDHRLYPFVEAYLIKKLPKGVKLNTWLWLSSDNIDFKNELNKQKNSVVRDPLIDNIIIQFPSRFKI